MDTPQTPSARESRCPRELLARFRQDRCTAEEAARVRQHLAGCEACRATLESLAVRAANLLLKHHDQEALKRFDPTSEYTDLCREIERRLDEISTAPHPPEPRIWQHLIACAFCRQRLLRRRAAGSSTATTVMAPALREAEAAAAKAAAVAGAAAAAELTWVAAGPDLVDLLAGAARHVRRLVEDITVALASGGTRGLVGVPIGPRLRTSVRVRGETAGAGQPTWQFPLPDRDATVRVGLREARTPGELELDCELVGGAAPELVATARIACYEPGQTAAFITHNLREIQPGQIRLSTPGRWLVSLTIEDDAFVVPIVVK